MNYIYRSIELTDFEQIDTFINQNFDDQFLAANDVSDLILNIRMRARYDSRLEWLASDQEHLIGHILLSEIRIQETNNPERGLFLLPYTVAVNYRTQGIGRMLFEHAIAEADQLGYPWIIAVGDKDYYRQLGFIDLGLTNFEPIDETQDVDNYMIYYIGDTDAGSWRGKIDLNF